MNQSNPNTLLWAIALILGFPFLIISLGELSHRFQRQGKAIASTLNIVRNLVLPVLVLMLLLQYILLVDKNSNLMKGVQTFFWVCLIHGALSLFNTILFQQANIDTWRSRVPKLLVDISRLFLIIVGIGIVLAKVWNADLAGLAAALGVSSIVIALALQDTLGSVMSGIALLFERPFNVGDWLKVGDLVGQVIDINWRAVRLQTLEKEMVIIPHKVISAEIIRNFSQPLRLHAERFSIGFSYQDPPNLAKKVLKNTALTTEGILTNPEPQVFTLSYDDSAINYEVKFYIEDYGNLEEIRDTFVSRIWYAAQRHNLNIPFPIRTLYHYNGPTYQAQGISNKMAQSLQSIPSFVPLDREADNLHTLTTGIVLQHFGKREYAVRQGDSGQALYIIISGEARMLIKNNNGEEEEVLRLKVGEFFGEMALFSGEPSRISIQAVEDMEVMTLSSAIVNQMIERQPSFAREIGQILENRRRAISSL